MKKLIFSLIAVTAMFLVTNAQVEKKMGNKHQPSRHDKEMLIKELNLTDAQKAQLKASREEFKMAMAELNKDESITLKEYRDKKEALQKAQKAKFQSILTPEQKQKAEQLKKDRQAQRELLASQKLEKMKVRLGLTDDQVAKIKADRASFQKKMMELKDNESLSRTERKEQIMKLKEQNKDGIKKYLTADQIKKFEVAKAAKEAKKEKTGKKPE